MEPQISPPRRLLRTALAVAVAYLVVAGLYFGLVYRMLAAALVGRDNVGLHVAAGWGFFLATAMGLFVLVWRLNLASWRHAQAEAGREVDELRRQNLLEIRLAEVDQQLRLLVEGAPGFFFYMQDPEGRTTYVSPSVEGITGRPVDAWLGHSDCFSADRAANGRNGEATRGHGSVERKGAPVLVEVAHAEGHLLVLEVYEQQRFEEGRLVGVQGIARDVTERVRAQRGLAESERRYRTLAEASRDFIFILNRDGFEYVNDVGGAAFGTSPAALVGRRLEELFPEPRVSGMRANVARVFEHGQPVNVEESVVLGGREIWLNTWLVPIREEAGAVDAVLGVSRDVTERRQSAAVQAAIHRISQAAISACGMQELFPAIHASVAELLPASNLYIALYDKATDVVSFPYWVDEVDPPPVPRRAARGLTEYVLRSAQPLLALPETVAALERSGEIESLGSPSLDWLGVPLRFQDRTIGVLVVQSYTERLRYGEREKQILEFVSSQIAMAIEQTRAEEALRDSEERYRRLVEASPDGIAIHHQERVVFANRQAARLLGLSSADMAVGRSALDFVHPDDLGLAAERMRRSAELGEVQPAVEERFLRADGTVVHVEVTATPFLHQGLPATLVVFRDIGERLRVAEQLRQVQKMEAVGELAGGVAHDFNNLLQAMLAGIQVLETERDDPARRTRVLTELEAHCRRGASLTRQLLLFSRRDVTRGEPLELGAVVGDTADLLHRLVPERVRMRLELDSEPLPVEADRGQLEQVLVNLVVNACDAMPGGGELVVRTGRTGDSAWVEVEDSGGGIEQSVRDHIFEPFFTTKPAGKGSGLGLAVVHGIVVAHRGEIQVESGEGRRGSAFRVLLPCRGGDRSQASLLASKSPGLCPGRGERVLLVEDEAGAREGLADVLTLLGYLVTAVASGEEASALPEEPRFDLLLTDFGLPGVGGTELAARLVARWPGLPVVVMSGYAADEGIRRAASEGSLTFLQKPFSMETLAREFRAAIEAGPGSEPLVGPQREG